MTKQTTLRNKISCSGTGLHSGQTVKMTLLPALQDTGIVFRRTDVEKGNCEIQARYDSVVDTKLCTVLANEDGISVGTVEHIVAAIAGLGVDNVVIELDGPEVPIMDGSSSLFVFLIECAGLVDLDASRRKLKVLKTVEVEDNGRSARLEPSDCFEFDLSIDFDCEVVGQQSFQFELHNGAFKRELCRARTFGFAEQVDYLKQIGLARGGSLDNAIVIKDDVILNEEGLRYSDEFIRHKTLDAIGDLALAGGRLEGKMSGSKAGHEMHNILLRALFADESAFEWRFDDGRDLVESDYVNSEAVAL